MARVLRVRWLGRVRYQDALALQHGLHRRGRGDHLLLVEHPHVYTTGVRARPEHLLADPAKVGAELARADRGGDVTYHGPGQLVGYPVLDWPPGRGSTPAYVHALEQVVIDALARLGLPGCGRLEGYPGVWVDPDGPSPRKICAVGVRVSRGRTMHGFALNVAPDLEMFGHIVPCGIADKAVTSLRSEGVEASMAKAIEAVVAEAPTLLRRRGDVEVVVERQGETPAGGAGDALAGPPAPSAANRPGAAPTARAGPAEREVPVALGRRGPALERRLARAGVDPTGTLSLADRKPSWLRVRARMGPEYLGLRSTIRGLDLTTVCEEAGCPNIYECWADGTATFMINGERCTRACGFCLVDTRRPGPLDPTEPDRVAAAVARMGLAHAVVTAVARDDLSDGGAEAFAATIAAIRARRPGTAVEVLIPDCKGDPAALRTIFEAAPDVLNHNLETVLRLQRAARPSASYARSLAVLARAKAAGLTTKSGLILGMGEEEAEVVGALEDLAGVGVDIVTIGQYLRPTAAHLPVVRWWAPTELDGIAEVARRMGFAHVEASPLTRSSYHARHAAEQGRAAGVGARGVGKAADGPSAASA